ncbi:MAG: MBL fold metallo-hydrolase [Bryobacterales bacterium]|nr:MBL fold metallo-hydrolase [Bryobacterales bacterium]MBV9400834.1 MBL fold metallo-hydrolase [Bryobacterales bacterium]
MYRRDFLKTGIAGALGTWVSRSLNAQQAPEIRRLNDSLSVVVDGAGSNVVLFSTDAGVVLVDSGAPKAGLQNLTLSYKVQNLFNTHYHLDQTGNNEVFGTAGAKIIAHEHTRQWMSTDYWIPDQDRYEKARSKAAQPTETFHTTGSLKAGTEQIDYGHLPLAHTDGDIYVFFKNSNVLAVGDVASPLRDPALDWFTGAWIGGRMEAMDSILRISNEQTRIVPAAGPVMTGTQFKAERDMMEEVRSRIWKQTLKGDSPKDMLEAGVLKGLARTWKDPYKFLYDAAKGMFAHHNKLDPSVV